MRKLEWLLLGIILVAGFFVRLYRFNNPIADWHSWRQADTSAVSRNFVAGGIDLLHPKFDDLSNVPSGLDNPNGYRFVEFPIFNLLQTGGYLLFDHFTLEEWGRIVTIFATLLSSLFIFLLVKKYANTLAGFLAMGLYVFLPYSIYYGRTILPDESMVTATLGGIWFFCSFIDIDSRKIVKKTVFYLAGLLLFAVALLLKPFSGFFFLPAVWLAYKKWGLKMMLRIDLWIVLVFSILPFGLWRMWMSKYPEGIPVSSWLFNAGNIRFKGAFFNWLFGQRIGALILGYWGLPLFVLGFIQKQKNNAFFYMFAVSSFLYLSVIARGNVQHDYYQIPIIPTIAIFLGLGGAFLLMSAKDISSKIVNYSVFAVCCIFMFAFSWFIVRDYFNINNPSIVVAGQAVDKLTPKNAKIVAPYDGDTSFLYQTKRKGWASFEKPLEQLIKMGAGYLVLVNPKQQDYNIGKTYKIVSATNDYILFDLHAKP